MVRLLLLIAAIYLNVLLPFLLLVVAVQLLAENIVVFMVIFFVESTADAAPIDGYYGGIVVRAIRGEGRLGWLLLMRLLQLGVMVMMMMMCGA